MTEIVWMADKLRGHCSIRQYVLAHEQNIYRLQEIKADRNKIYEEYYLQRCNALYFGRSLSNCLRVCFLLIVGFLIGVLFNTEN
jgi:hypothetical protein